MTEERSQFDRLGEDYASFVAQDPIRNHLHYPSVIKEMRKLQNGQILDIGCGDGAFDRLIAKQFGAHVHAFDVAPDLIKIAKDQENVSSLGIKYAVSEANHYRADEQVDYAISVMVLPYATDQKELQSLFKCAYTNLKPDSPFISVVFNPSFSEFETILANRRFSQLPESKVQVHFLSLDGQKEHFTSLLTQYSQADYEVAAKSSGFSSIEWIRLLPEEVGVEKFGQSFWQNCARLQPYVLLKCSK